MHLWFDCLFLFYLGLWKVVFINWRVGCINEGGPSIMEMEGIAANLLGQLDFIWKVQRIHPSPNADLFGTCC